ncbi:polysaccharide pyruvyl transferase family protein [Isoptericola sp. NPDC057191]|uniref:polysaccharide pyruvyl transferase family protein n=1 Tax=Isoptericola sp. NPDC057191 TaxID=3346041 RepID=UPI00364372E6
MRVGLLGGWGTGNPGNDATARVVADHLRGQHDVVLVTYAGHPLPVSGLEDLRWAPLGDDAPPSGRTRAGRLLHRVRSAVDSLHRAWRTGRDVGALVIAGGGVYEAEATAGVGVLGALALVVLAFASSTHGRRLVVLAVGGTTVRSRAERALLVLATRRASYRSFRDQASRAALLEMGGASPDDPVRTDVVFASAPDTPSAPEPGAGAPAAHEGRGLLALGVLRFPWLGPGGPADLALTPYVQALAETVAQHVTGGGTVALVGGDVSDLPVADAVRSEAARRLGDAAVATSVEVWGAPPFAELVPRLARCDLVVASRFHTLVAAVVAGRPVLAVADRAKVRSLMRDAGLASWVLEARGLEAARLDKLLGELRDQETAVRDLVVAARDRLAGTAREQLSELDAVLARPAAAGR